MLDERQLPEEWMWRTVQHPDRRGHDVAGGGNMHYACRTVQGEQAVRRGTAGGESTSALRPGLSADW